ncbi:MAG: hypothetical protein IIB60_06815, partial [Planctomycetes bacterium]|nr:hypothetical protein [Planctomycetota bacterium]
AIGCGLFQAVSFWHHPFVPTLLSAGFLLQVFWARHRRPVGPRAEPTDPGMIRRNLLIVAVTLVMASPILYLMIHGPMLNPLPRDYLAEELRTVAFPLMHGNLWLWAMGAIGVVACVVRADWASRLLVSCLGIAAAAQIPGYLRIYGGQWADTLPTFVPHEFQRLFQLGWAIAIGIGLDATIRAGAARVGDLRNRRRAVLAMTLAGALITGAWGLVTAPNELRRFLQHEPLPARFDGATRWILANTSIDDVFVCEPAMAFRWLHWSTGRKVWLLTEGHSNPRVDWTERHSVLIAMEDAPSPRAFWDLAHGNGINYFIPSAEWNPRAVIEPGSARAEVFRYVRLVYGDLSAVAIYQVLDSPTP